MTFVMEQVGRLPSFSQKRREDGKEPPRLSHLLVLEKVLVFRNLRTGPLSVWSASVALAKPSWAPRDSQPSLKMTEAPELKRGGLGRWLHKHEGVSSNPQHMSKKLGVASYGCTSRAGGGVERGVLRACWPPT